MHVWPRPPARLEILDGPYSDYQQCRTGFRAEWRVRGAIRRLRRQDPDSPARIDASIRFFHAALRRSGARRRKTSRRSNAVKCRRAALFQPTAEWWERRHADMANVPVAIADAIAESLTLGGATRCHGAPRILAVALQWAKPRLRRFPLPARPPCRGQVPIWLRSTALDLNCQERSRCIYANRGMGRYCWR